MPVQVEGREATRPSTKHYSATESTELTRTTAPHDLLDLLEDAQRRALEHNTAVAVIAKRLAPVADLYRRAAAVNEDAARFVGRFDALTTDQATTTPRTLNAQEAAERLRMVKPNGTPRDSFYTTVAPRIGVRIGKAWRFPEDRVAAFERGEL